MADQNEKDTNDDFDIGFDSAEGPLEADGTADMIRKAYAAQQEDDGDEDGLDQPFKEPDGEEPDVVSPEAGRKLLDDADVNKNARKSKAKDAPKAEDADDAASKDDTPEAKGDDAPEDAEADQATDGEKPFDYSPESVAALLADVPEDKRGAISKQLNDARSVLEPFTKNAEALQAHGASPREVFERIAYLNSFAQEKPHEYMAWVASQTSEDPVATFTAAAEMLGLSVSKKEEDDDLFEDPQILELRRENERLKAQMNGNALPFGPDTPERRQQRDMQSQVFSFVNETDEAGNLKRPHFEVVRPRILEMVQQHAAQSGKPADIADLSRYYDAALQEVSARFAPQPAPSATQQVPDVASQVKKQADAARKAQQASKTVDGTGQGASRRPALPANATARDIIRALAEK